MSMHLEGPGLTTTSTKKRVVKITKSQQEEIERGWRERNVRLRQMGLPKETVEQYIEWLYGRGKKPKDTSKTKAAVVKTSIIKQGKENTFTSEIPPLTLGTRVNDGQPKSLGSWTKGPVSSKPTPAYTGTKILGIGTMHKSNMVPIFNDQEAEDIARMRR